MTWRWAMVLALTTASVQPAITEPSMPEGVAKARALAARGDHVQAARIYKELLTGNDEGAAPAEVHRGFARSLMLAGQPEEAMGTVTRALVLYPEDPALQRVAAGVYSSQGQYAMAISSLERALALDPGQAADHANLGGLYTALGRFDDAEAALLRAQFLASEDAVVRQRLGTLYLKRHRYDDARHQLEAATRLDTTSPTAVYLLGRALEGLGATQRALAHYDTARQLDPSYMDAHYRVAQLARRLGWEARANSALAAYSHLQDVGDGDADALKQMRLLRDAIVESGDQPDHVFALAKFLLEQGYLDEAQNRFDAVLNRRPADYRALNQLGNIHLRRRAPGLALEQYERATHMAPEFAPAALNAGNACMLLQQPGRALPFYERVVTLAPEVSMGWYGLASAHLELARPGVAIGILEQGLERTRPQGKTKTAFLELLRKARGARDSQ